MTSAATEDRADEQPEFLDEGHHVPRSDFVRLLQQALAELGHCEISRSLEQATNITCESSHITQLRECVLEGQWLQACECVQGCAELSATQLQQVRFVLLREHALEVRVSDFFTPLPVPEWDFQDNRKDAGCDVVAQHRFFLCDAVDG